jgi:hypothetical protein
MTILSRKTRLRYCNEEDETRQNLPSNQYLVYIMRCDGSAQVLWMPPRKRQQDCLLSTSTLDLSCLFYFGSPMIDISTYGIPAFA